MASGFYYRTGVIDEHGIDSKKDPFMGSYPHLLDVGIMGHCVHGQTGLCLQAGIQCYQDGLHKTQDNMRLEDFKTIVDQSKDKMFQIALGGRGDPDMHEEFEEILAYCRANEIIPNMTTSGYGLTDENADLMKRYCGAVAVSWYRSPYTLRAIEMLLERGVKTNIHYVLGNNSIDEAYEMISKKKIPEKINRVIFLLHKPVGLGRSDNVLKPDDPKVEAFFELFNEEDNVNIAGFDSCCVPGVISFAPIVHLDSIDTCEAARYSAYVTPDMKMTPCSFDQELKYQVDLSKNTIQEAWDSATFERFRNKLRMRCPDCEKRHYCLGGCPLKKEIVLCKEFQGVKV